MQVATNHFFWHGTAHPTLFVGGANAVNLFFVMSGFMMMVAYADAPGGVLFAHEFWKRRAARIVPVYVLSVMLQSPFLIFPDGLLDLVLTLTFTQTWFGTGHLHVNQPLWTLSVQFTFWLLFPFIVTRVKAASNHAMFAAVLLCSLLVHIILFCLLYVSVDDHELGSLWARLDVLTGAEPPRAPVMRDNAYITAHCNPFIKLPLFYIGMASGAQARQEASSVSPMWSQVANYTSILVIGFDLVLTFASVMGSYYTGTALRILGELVLPPIFGLWLCALSLSPSSIASRIMNLAIFRHLGDWSYALYCLHIPVYNYLACFRVRWQTEPIQPLLVELINNKPLLDLSLADGCFTFTSVLLVSSVTFVYFEQPMRKALSQKLFNASLL